ncbi:MAG: DNA-directed RNA polymerase subunit P [Candidatus Aenigmarchaeota archaeon]|nr:DNA-directed RNA polymerase subunit P [Candidatus Aenigmarchaeota archaeon]
MNLYKCVKCKKIVTKIDEKIRCPYCGYRIFVKLRPEVIKRVRAR